MLAQKRDPRDLKGYDRFQPLSTQIPIPNVSSHLGTGFTGGKALPPPTLRLQASSSREAISSREGLAGRRDPPEERNARVLRIRLPLEAAPSTPGPEEWEEEEEEFLRRDESQDNLGVQATSSSCWAFRRLGLLAPPERDAELGADRLEAATSLVSRRQLRLREHPSEVLLQWYLTLRLSDAMGTCKVKRRAGIQHHPSQLPLLTLPPSRGPRGEGKPGQSQGLALLTFPPSFHCPSQVSRFQRCQSASEKSERCKIY